MQITLSPEAQAVIDRKLASGDYDTAEAVINEALLHFPENGVPHVPDELLVAAREQSERGEGRPFTEVVMKELLARARSRANQGLPVRDDVTY